MWKKLYLLVWCVAIAITAYVLLDYWAFQASHPVEKLERMWGEDVRVLEASKKLPKSWFHIKNVELYGGTDEAKAWLKRLKAPIKTHVDGTHTLEILLLVWEEDGKKGAVVQYNITDIKTKNMTWELGRTFVLSSAPLDVKSLISQ